MKILLYISSLLLGLSLLGQKPTDKVGEIEVQLVSHFFKENSRHKLTKRVNNRASRPYLVMYFDETGVLLKSLGYGKHHNMDLRLLDIVDIYQYDTNGIKSRVDVWRTDYEKNLEYVWYYTFDLDSSKSNILSSKSHNVKTDSIDSRTDYWYNEKGLFQGLYYDSTYYYKREYNADNKIISLQQIYQSKLRWKWDYTYDENELVGVFQTFYEDDENRSKKEISKFNEFSQLVEIEEFYLSKDGIREKYRLHYDEFGVLKKIENFQSYRQNDEYKFRYYIDVIVKTSLKIDINTAMKINEQIEFK